MPRRRTIPRELAVHQCPGCKNWQLEYPRAWIWVGCQDVGDAIQEHWTECLERQIADKSLRLL